MKSKIAGCKHHESKVISKYANGGFVGMTADGQPVSMSYTGVDVNRAGKSDNENPMGVNRAGKDYYNPPRVNREGKDDNENPAGVNRAAKVDLPKVKRDAPPKPRMRPEAAAPKAAAPKPTAKPVRAKETSFQDAVRRNESDEYTRNKMKPKKSLFGKKLFGKG